MSKYSKKAEKYISHKMHKMKGEDKPHAQKVAIALSMAREKGLKVPSKKGGRPDIHCSDHSALSNNTRRGSNLKHATRKYKA